LRIEVRVSTDDDKRRAAEAAVAEIESGMLVGLGTGSTAAYAIAAIGARIKTGLEIKAVATSLASERRAVWHGIELLDFEDVASVDLVIDGADELDSRLRAIKGAGGAMLREKIVASAAKRMVIVVDGSKRVERLGAAPLPIEVLPFARSFVAAELRKLGGEPVLRRAGSNLDLTDQHNIVLDCEFSRLDAPDELAAALAAIPGVLAHGLFLHEADAAYVGIDGRVERLERH
jgi:ribose 5-phosphate isomerase A